MHSPALNGIMKSGDSLEEPIRHPVHQFSDKLYRVSPFSTRIHLKTPSKLIVTIKLFGFIGYYAMTTDFSL